MCHVLVTVFPPLYRSLSKRVPVGRVREHHTLPTHLSSENQSHLHMQKKNKKLKSGSRAVAVRKKVKDYFCEIAFKLDLQCPSR